MNPACWLTLVVSTGGLWWTPKVNAAAGRDHHCKAWSIVFAAAGSGGGSILGATDKTAVEITNLPAKPEDFVLQPVFDPWHRSTPRVSGVNWATGEDH